MAYVLRRVGVFILTVWVAITLNFVLPRLMPGNPAQALVAKFQGKIDARTLQAIEEQFGLSHDPMWKQYIDYLWNLLHGNLGVSYTYFPIKVSTVISSALPYTIALVGISTIIAFLVGTLMGIYGAWRRNGLVDSIQSVVFIFLQSVPAFWLGLLMLWYFGFVKGWFPLNHAYSDDAKPSFTWSFMGDLLHHAFLPAMSLLLTSLGGWMLGMRNMMVQTNGEDYIVFAEAKGVPKFDLMIRYAARNAILPNFTGFGMAIAGVVAGSILVETVFSYPGIGYTLQAAVLSEDYPLMQGILLIISVVTLVANLVVDLLYSRLDPRVRTGGVGA
jgi:peptide/nickel transport system permease protein